MLFLRQLDQLSDVMVRGSERGESPFFSPDGQWLGFFVDQELRKIPVGGGTAITICKVTGTGRGATWNQHGTIVFSTGGTAGLWKVSAEGGDAQPFTNPQQKVVDTSVGHKLPSFLPGGDWVLFVEGSQGLWDDGRILAKSIATGEEREIYRGGSAPRYSPTGHVIVSRTGSLWAVPFDVENVRAGGSATEIEAGVFTHQGNGVAQYDFAPTGLLVFAPRDDEDNRLTTVAWVDREGRGVEVPELRKPLNGAQLSPDGTRVALMMQGDIWIYEFARRMLAPLTVGSNQEGNPSWTADARRIAYSSNNSRIFWKPIDQSAPEELLVDGGAPGSYPRSWTPDGGSLLFQRGSGTLFNDIWLLPLDGNRAPKPFIATTSNETGAAISPDGRLVAYESGQLGRDEIYLRAFAGGGIVQVSTGGGTLPAWSADGQELFYHAGSNQRNLGASQLAGGALMTVAVSFQDPPEVSSPRVLLDASFGTLAGPSPDGRRFLMVKRDLQGPASNFTLVSGWFEELRRKTASN